MSGVNITDSNRTNDSDTTIVEIEGPSGNKLEITAEGEAKISSFANVSFVTANKTATTTELLVNVSGTNLANRKSVVVYNRGAQDIYYGPTGVDDTTGVVISKDELVAFEVGDSINLYIVTKTGTATVTIQEFA